MKLLLVTGIFPPDHGGPAGYVPRIAAELVRRGHAVRVVCLSDRLDHDDSGYPFAVHRIRRGMPMAARMLRTAAAIYRGSRGADAVLVNGLRLEAMAATRLSGAPAVHKVVGDQAWERARNRGWFAGTLDEYQRAPKPARLRLLDWLRTVPLRGAARVIVPSRYLGRIVEGWGFPPARTALVYNAVEPPVAAPADEAGLPPFAGPTLVTVCRLVPWKGVEGVIRALPELAGARLAVVGDGPLRAPLEALARELGVAERVLFTGGVPAARVRAILRQADVFVLNSSYEGLPHVVLEAMAEGAPVVATDAGGTGEVVEHGVTGLLVEPGRPEALVAAVRTLLHDPAAARALRDGAARALERRFSYAAMVQDTERLLANPREGA
jgi:glycosyltransferase involved in cell wall biosynthesis